MIFCRKDIRSRGNSKYDPENLHKCFREPGHPGACKEFPYLEHLNEVAPRVSAKIKRDATKTTGASWKSEDAGPNRISRWTMLLSDAELLALGINMAALKPWVVAKLREKAATYDDCVSAAMRLTWFAYSMENAPPPDNDTKAYLENIFGEIRQESIRRRSPCGRCHAFEGIADAPQFYRVGDADAHAAFAGGPFGQPVTPASHAIVRDSLIRMNLGRLTWDAKTGR